MGVGSFSALASAASAFEAELVALTCGVALLMQSVMNRPADVPLYGITLQEAVSYLQSETTGIIDLE